MKNLIRAFLTFFFSVPFLFHWTPAMASAVDQDLQSWTVLILRKPLSDELRSYLEVQPRLNQGSGHLDRVIFRPALWTSVAPGWTLWAGVAAIPAFGSTTSWEYRVWEQVQWEGSTPVVGWINRFRLEERFLPGVSPVAIRARHLFRVQVPLADSSVWSLVVSDEFFVNLNSAGRGAAFGFDQNRLFLGARYVIDAQKNLEFGYLNQFVDRHQNGPDQLNHVFQLALNFNYQRTP
jgi:hypothetical protein